MEKRKFYISVGSGTILAEKEEAMDFEVEASVKELEKLEQLFDQADLVEPAANRREPVGVPEAEDDSLREVYQYIYEIGTNDTKRQMEDMNLV
ncbi:hypothetical protein [Paenibacillus turpanensis]|uniref:hypothetical protein n=1 Tax=Paenibacillus turpanensis TaxID=2689078 RepID=UPI0014084FA0|nr:hypothetical protein [Paenibacillus turpanensis]